MSEWSSFQADVLDVLRQYSGFLDFFEQVGSTGENSRPDCFARVSREGKKEVWIVDAKNRQQLGDADVERMEKYVEMVSADPVDVGLDFQELKEHDIRGIFVAPGELDQERFEAVEFRRLHQFLQRELVYTDTDRVVRDVSRMVERGEISQNQARLLYRSLRPYIKTLESGMELLRQLELEYTGMKLSEPPIESYSGSIGVDAVLKHGPRCKAFLIDIPYTRGKEVAGEERIQQIKESLDRAGEEVYYAVLDRESDGDAEHVYGIDELRHEVRNTAGIVSPEEVATWFKPRTGLEKTVKDGGLVFSGDEFRLEVSSRDDISHVVEAELPEDAASRLRETMANAGTELGEVDGGRFSLELEVTEDLEVEYGDTSQPLDSFMKTARRIFRSSVSPSLAATSSRQT